MLRPMTARIEFRFAILLLALLGDIPGDIHALETVGAWSISVRTGWPGLAVTPPGAHEPGAFRVLPYDWETLSSKSPILPGFSKATTIRTT